MQAKDSRNYSILKLLLENGADPNIKLLHNEASLYYYMVLDSSRIVEFLLQYGADPNMVDRNGKNPLFEAFLFDDDHTMKILLKYGANPNMLDENGRGPLYKAINCDNDKREKYLELLLKYGADPNQKVNGSRVIECAPYFTNNGVMNLIKTLTLPYGSNDKVKGWMAEYGGVDRRYLRDQKILTYCCLIVASATFVIIAFPLRYVPTAIFALAACFFIKMLYMLHFLQKNLLLSLPKLELVQRLVKEAIISKVLVLGKDEKKAPSRPKLKGMDKNRKLIQSIIQESKKKYTLV